MANNLSGACAWYKFESGALLTDSTANANTLSNTGPVAEDTTNFAEGSCSAGYDTWDYLSRTNANLSSGFPLKDGETNKDLTVVGWFRPHTAGYGNIWPFFSTYVFAGYSGLIFLVNGNSSIDVALGYGTGAESHACAYTFTPDTWYHIGASWNDATKTATYRIWNGSTASTLSAEYTNGVTVGAGPFKIGESTRYLSGSDTYNFDGQIDEYAVFNTVLSIDDIDAIRGGTYTGEPDYEDMAAECAITFGATAVLDYYSAGDLAAECAITIGMSSSLGNSAPILIRDVADKHVATYLVAAGNNSFWYSTG